MKTPAVQWLINEKNKGSNLSYDNMFDKAKEMEKQQQGYSEENMKEAYNSGKCK